MTVRKLVHAAAVWLVFMAGAIANGTFRVALLEPSLGLATAHAVSTVMLVAIILGVAYAFLVRRVDSYSTTDVWMVGGLWLGLTVAFEFGFGHYVAGKEWSVLLHDYDVAEGRVWILVPIATLLTPRLLKWCGSRRRGRSSTNHLIA